MNNILAFLQEVRTEINKVIWPTRRQAFEMTIVVIVISLLVGAYVGGLDLVFTSLMDRLL